MKMLNLWRRPISTLLIYLCFLSDFFFRRTLGQMLQSIFSEAWLQSSIIGTHTMIFISEISHSLQSHYQVYLSGTVFLYLSSH